MNNSRSSSFPLFILFIFAIYGATAWQTLRQPRVGSGRWAGRTTQPSTGCWGMRARGRSMSHEGVSPYFILNGAPPKDAWCTPT